MSLVDLLTGNATLLVGIADHPGGGLKCYVGARWKGIYCLVVDEADIAEVRRQWDSGQKVLMPLPSSEELFSDAEGVK